LAEPYVLDEGVTCIDVSGHRQLAWSDVAGYFARGFHSDTT
jgi:hypothetical protein